MSATKEDSFSLPTLDYNTVINNIIQADGNEIIEHINDFLEKENINLPFQKVIQQTRQLVQSYMDNVNNIEGLENKTIEALKNVEHAQRLVENSLQDIQVHQNML
ncbi:unnamed protein product [Cunninghamella echinulata]